MVWLGRGFISKELEVESKVSIIKLSIEGMVWSEFRQDHSFARRKNSDLLTFASKSILNPYLGTHPFNEIKAILQTNSSLRFVIDLANIKTEGWPKLRAKKFSF